MEVNEEKRKKFMEYAGKRVNNVLHDIQILEPMSRSSAYDFTKQDVEEMFTAMQESLNNAKIEFEKKFEEKTRSEKKLFSFGGLTNAATKNEEVPSVAPYSEEGEFGLSKDDSRESSFVEESIDDAMPIQSMDENLDETIPEMF